MLKCSLTCVYPCSNYRSMLGQAVKFCGKRLVRRNAYAEMFRQTSTKSAAPVVGSKTASVSTEDEHQRVYLKNAREKIYSVEVNCIPDKMRQKFNSTFPDIVKDLTEPVKNAPYLRNWYRRLLEYNVPNGRQRRGLCMLLSYQLVEHPHKLTQENMRLASIMAWCTELITAGILVSDDIVDQSEQRRGVPCWYKLKDIGLSSVLDATILEDSAYVLLQKHFRNHPCYMAIVEYFHHINLNVYIGQSLDHRNTINQTPTLEHISKDVYDTIVQFKAIDAAFLFPVCTAMYLAGIDDVSLHDQIKTILRPIGYLTQVKNDFLDCFGQENTSGKKLYEDIRVGKCTWPSVVTLQRATPAQRTVMEQCYGRPDEQSVQAVMDVYKALDMPTLYADFEEKTLNNFLSQLEQLHPRLPKQMLLAILEMF